MLTDEQKAAGWIEHEGKGCSVPLDSRVRVAFRAGGGTGTAMAARVWTWGIDQWQHMNRDFDIIAYRPENPHD